MVKRAKRWYKLCKGFTLMEVLVTVLIIGVLAAISYPVYKKSVTKARAAEAVNLIQLVKNKQILTYANEGKYFSSFAGIGKITQGTEEAQGAQLIVNRDYTVYLNNAQTCVTAYYKKDTPAEFSFSSGYENDGLGCSGGVCSSYGNILGDTKSVCNCGTKTCGNGYTLNQDTCSCECLLGCENGGSCYAPYGGGQSRPCASGCGTEHSSSTCGGPSWSGLCSSPTQTQATSQRCGRANSGTQTRTCSASCGGGECGGWSACKGQTCDENSKPVLSESCGNNGTHTRTVTCNSDTGNWNTPSEWSACTGQTCDENTKPASTMQCENCGEKSQTVTCNNGIWEEGGFGDCIGSKNESLACDDGYSGTKTRSCTNNVWSNWDTSSCVDERCTMGAWIKVSSNGTTTCTDTPKKGCVEYAPCGTPDKPCNTQVVENSSSQSMTLQCGGVQTSCADCVTCGCNSGPGSPPEYSGFGLNKCPTSNICDIIGAGASCYSGFSITSGKCTTETDNYSCGGCDPYYEPYSCQSYCDYDYVYVGKVNANVTIKKCTQENLPTYYKRTCN